MTSLLPSLLNEIDGYSLVTKSGVINNSGVLESHLLWPVVPEDTNPGVLCSDVSRIATIADALVTTPLQDMQFEQLEAPSHLEAHNVVVAHGASEVANVVLFSWDDAFGVLYELPSRDFVRVLDWAEPATDGLVPAWYILEAGLLLVRRALFEFGLPISSVPLPESDS